MQQLGLFGGVRVGRIMNALQDPRLIPQDLLWSRRIPLQPAMDEDITARFFGTIQIADIIADDAKGVVYSTGKFQFETVKIPNLKVGMGINQTTINLLDRLERNGRLDGVEMDLFDRWQTQTVDRTRIGVMQRMEQLRCAMLADGVGFTYDRFGIKLTNPTWGIYSDLKVTTGVAWSNAGTATPVADILNLKFVAKTRYGIDYTRITMSTAAFRLMIATTEFQTQAKLFIPAQLTFANLSVLQTEQMRALAQSTLGMEIEFYDARYWSQDTAGAITLAPYMPLNVVILSNPANDGNTAVWDFANAPVTEAIVSRVVGGGGGIIGGITGTYGPLAYVTLADAQMNPPGLIHWGVGRGWPRKHMLQANGVLNVGTVTDIVTTTVPFPQ